MRNTTHGRRVSPFAFVMIAAIALGLSHPLTRAAATRGEHDHAFRAGAFQQARASRRLLLRWPWATCRSSTLL